MKNKTVGRLMKAIEKMRISEEDKRIEEEIKEGWIRWRKRLTKEINNERLN